MTKILFQVDKNTYSCFNYMFEFTSNGKIVIYKDKESYSPELYEIEQLLELLKWPADPSTDIMEYERGLITDIIKDLKERADRIRTNAERIIKDRENTMTKLGLRIEEQSAEIVELKQQLVDQKIELEAKIDAANTLSSQILFLCGVGGSFALSGYINPLIPIGTATVLYYVKTTKNEHIRSLLHLAKSITIRNSGSKLDSLPAGDGAK